MMRFNVLLLLTAAGLSAQVLPPPAPWRGAGPQACFGSDAGVYKCVPAPPDYAIRAGRMFDSITGNMLQRQVVLVSGGKITQVGAEGQVRIPAGTAVIDLSGATLLPGFIDAHTHMFNNTPLKKIPMEEAMLIAVQNAQADLRAGFVGARDMSTHGHGYSDIQMRNAIKEGRIDGPRYVVSTRGIQWAAKPANPEAPDDPYTFQLVRNADEAKRAVDEQISKGADWIKLFPAGAYSFDASGKDEYEVTYPLPVLQVLIDEAHRLGHKTGCHVYGGVGQKNAIVAGCDTIEHAFHLDQEQVNMMVAKKLYYDPTLIRYSEPYLDDADIKNTDGKYHIIPIFHKSATLAASTPGIPVMLGSGVDGGTFPHGSQGIEFAALVHFAGLTPTRALQSGTITNARALGWDKEMGSIEKGKNADFVAVSGDPIADITETERVKFVMKDGKIIKDDIHVPAPAK